MNVLEIDTWFVMMNCMHTNPPITHFPHCFGYFIVKKEMFDTFLTFWTQITLGIS